MAGNTNYDKARELTEDAMKKAVEGDDKGAEALGQKASATNPQAVEDVFQDLDEDATADHDPKKLNEQLREDANKG
jgi:hypothetical protein